MKFRMRPFLAVCLLIAALFVISGCSSIGEEYRKNQDDGYNISVRFDANGGEFSAGVEAMSDFFHPDNLTVNQDGFYEIPLIPTDSELRQESPKPSLAGHFLVGWYAERTETAEGYVYSKKWNFDSDKLKISASGKYKASEPVLTLYAVWAPNISIEVVDLETDNVMGTIVFNPNIDVVKVPEWDTKKGTIKMHNFPVKEGYTFNAAYYDKECTKPVDTDTVIHSSTLDESTGKVENPVTRVYVDYWKGEWYRVYDTKFFRNFNDLSANYMIMNDLDFEGQIWPTALLHGNFSGTIQGNGHTIKNVSVVQTANSKLRTGLFGELMDGAVISDLHFENVELTIKGGTRFAGAYFGLFSGAISDQAELNNVSLHTGKILIDSDIYYTEDSVYDIGLICVGGNPDALDYSNITVEGTGENPDKYEIAVNGNVVSISPTEIE